MNLFKRKEIVHRDFAACLTEYLEGGLSPRDRDRFEHHLAQCPPCGAYLEQMRLTLAVAGRIEPGQVPAALRDELVHAFGAWRQK